MYPLEWPKSRILTPPNAGKGAEPQELSFTTVGMKNGTVTLEHSLEGSYKTKYNFCRTIM